MYSTRTRVHARIPNGHPRVYRTKVGGQVGEEVRVGVGVCVRVRVGAVECQLNSMPDRHIPTVPFLQGSL